MSEKSAPKAPENVDPPESGGYTRFLLPSRPTAISLDVPLTDPPPRRSPRPPDDLTLGPLRRFSPRRRPWREVAEIDDRLAELDRRRGELAERIGRLEFELKEAERSDCRVTSGRTMGARVSLRRRRRSRPKAGAHARWTIVKGGARDTNHHVLGGRSRLAPLRRGLDLVCPRRCGERWRPRPEAGSALGIDSRGPGRASANESGDRRGFEAEQRSTT